jgi:hypothetical protein
MATTRPCDDYLRMFSPRVVRDATWSSRRARSCGDPAKADSMAGFRDGLLCASPARSSEFDRSSLKHCTNILNSVVSRGVPRVPLVVHTLPLETKVAARNPNKLAPAVSEAHRYSQTDLERESVASSGTLLEI